MSNLLIRIDKEYRESLSFSLVSADDIFEIEDLNIKVAEAYPCYSIGVMIEGLLIPNAYTVPLIPNYDTYGLYPLTIENNSSWILKGKDIEKFSLNFKIPNMTALSIFLEVIAKNHISNEIVKVTSETIFIEKNGEKADKSRKYNFERNKFSCEFSVYLYKTFISKDLNYLKVISSEHHKEILSEIVKLLDINPKNARNANDLYTAFDFDYHPLIVERLFKIIEEIHNLQSKDGDILLLKPSLWGVGIDLKQLYKKISKNLNSS